ncbi:FAD-dependent monooxygenase, partial [Mycobacterium tuberculosis]|nr:FAD-dependent monooxygenase [Mycobacterium tuberculosis]
ATADVPIRWDTFEFVQLSTWSRGAVAFVGDAAHAQPPYLGQGGGTAMTNAIALAATVSRPGTGVPEALADWERNTRPEIDRTQRTSYGMRLLNHIPDGLRVPLLSTIGRVPGFSDLHLSTARRQSAATV